MINANDIVGSHDVIFITLDALRYDVAVEALQAGMTPNIAAVLPSGKWELRHTPGNFTYAAHQAFFAGFLPTPATPGKHERLFAAKFHGSETSGERTYVFEQSNIVAGFENVGYETVCIGGVGFFNKQTELGRVLPGLFQHSYWSVEMGVTEYHSARWQFGLGVKTLQELHAKETNNRLFLFINVSATHQPNCLYVDGASEDSVETQKASLAYVDTELGKLLDAIRTLSRPTLVILSSDHGTAYGEDGYFGHRVCHPVVWNVPYAEFILT